MKRIAILLFLTASFLACNVSSVNGQCAMCKASVEKSDADHTSFQQMAGGLNAGILYLMSIPYILACIIGFFWYKSSKKEQKRRAEMRLASNRQAIV